MIIIDKLSYSSGLADVSPEEKFAYAVLTLLVCVVSRSVTAAVIVLAVNGILNVKKGKSSISPVPEIPDGTPDISAVEYTGNPGQCIQRAAGCLCNPGGAVLCDIQLDGAEKGGQMILTALASDFQSVCPVF
mgnify:FL=1